MWDFQPIIDIWKAYAGTGSLLVLFLLSLFYIWKKEERKDIRGLMVWGSVLIARVFPVFDSGKISSVIGFGNLYRVLGFYLWACPCLCGDAVAAKGQRCAGGRRHGDKNDEKTMIFRRNPRPWVQPVGLLVRQQWWHCPEVWYTKAHTFPRQRMPTIFPR